MTLIKKIERKLQSTEEYAKQSNKQSKAKKILTK